MKKTGICCLFVLFFFSLSLFAVSAASGMESEAAAIEKEYEEFLSAIPPEVQEYLPKELLSGDMEKAEEALREGAGVRAVFSALGRITGLGLGEALSLLARLCGLLLLSAVFRSLAPEKKNGVAAAFSLLSTLSLLLLLFSAGGGSLAQLDGFFDTVKTLSASILPLMGTLYAMGGNVRAAVVNQGVMSAFLSLLEVFLSGTVMPIAGISLAFSLMDAVSERVKLRPLAGVIKRTYTLSLSFCMLLLCGVLGVQSTLAKAGDTLALRTARFAAGSFLPLVGGSVGETLRTVAGSVQYLRAVTGTGAVAVLFFLFLPTFLSVLLSRICFMLSASVAGMLSANAEEKVLSELASVYGYFLAIISTLFVTVVFSLTLFARCAAAG